MGRVIPSLKRTKKPMIMTNTAIAASVIFPIDSILLGISVVAFNNNSQSNHIIVPFTVTSQYSSSTFTLANVIAFFGGFSNFLITILSLGGLVIAYASLRRQGNPDLIVQGLSPKGKTEKIVLKGKK